MCLLPTLYIKAQEDNTYNRKSRGTWFATGLYSFNLANNGFTYSKIGAMGGYLGNWGGYAKIGFDLTGNRTPNIVLGATKRLTTFHSHTTEIPTSLYIYFGAGCGNVEHAGRGIPGYYIDLPNGFTQWVPTSDKEKTYWDGGTQAMFDIGLILRYKRMNFNIGYSITPDFGFIAGEGQAANHSIQIGAGYTF